MIKFNVKFSDATYRVVGELAEWMDGSMADVIREALSVFWWLAKEYRQGGRLMVRRGDDVTELMIPSLERLTLAASISDQESPAPIGDASNDAAPARRRRRQTASRE
jgi:hypothetical protein